MLCLSITFLLSNPRLTPAFHFGPRVPCRADMSSRRVRVLGLAAGLAILPECPGDALCSDLSSLFCPLSPRHSGIYQYSCGPGQHPRRGQWPLPRDEREGGAVRIGKCPGPRPRAAHGGRTVLSLHYKSPEIETEAIWKESVSSCFLRQSISFLLIDIRPGSSLDQLLRKCFIHMPNRVHYQVHKKFTSVKNPIFLY